MSERTKSRPRPKGAKGSPSSDKQPSPGLRLLWLALFTGWALVTASMLSFSPVDFPNHGAATADGHVSNWIGPVGSAVAGLLFSTFGSGMWLIQGAAGFYLFLIAYRGSVAHAPLRAVGVAMVALAFSGYHALLLPDVSRMPEGGGGAIAIWGAHHLQVRFGTLGAAMWLGLLAAVGLTVAFDRWLIIVPRLLGHAGRKVGAASAVGATAVADRLKQAREQERQTAKVQKTQSDAVSSFFGAIARLRQRSAPAAELAVNGTSIRENDLDTPMPAPVSRRSKPAPTIEEIELDEHAAEVEDIDDLELNSADVDEDVEAEDADDGEPKNYDPDELREKIARLPIRFAGTAKRAATQEDLDTLREIRASEEEADRRYTFPPLDLLENPEENYNAELEEYVREQAQLLEAALHQYGIKGEVVGIDSGPVVTLFQVRLAPGTKVSSITSVASDIARSLRSVNIRIVANTEGMDTVGVEVPNRKKEKVRIKELMTTSEATAKMRLPLFLGKDASGQPLITDLASLPHVLIAGTTGSGKSVCMNAIIMGFLYTQKPSDMKLVLVDPKMVELSQFKDIPHLMCPVITDMSKAAAILEWAVNKMDERYELLAEAGCRDIAAYNSLGWEELRSRLNPQNELEEAKIPRKLPYMVFVIDELADLMMTNKEVEHSIVRIAQKARAVGIHLILATQRPQANVVTGLIKSNMPGRVSFKVASGMDSRIVLDQKGGELLLGQGDMLMITPRSAVPIRAQGTLVDDAEIRRVVKFVREVGGPSFEHQLVQLRGTGMSAEDHEARMRQSAEEDPLFDKAVEIVLETQRGSVSLLQRRLAIGYTRASRLIELMGLSGILGDHKGSVARECLITFDEWQAMKAQAAADEQAASDAEPKPTPSASKPGTTGSLFRTAPWEAAGDTTVPASITKPAKDDDEFTADDEDDAEAVDEVEEAEEEDVEVEDSAEEGDDEYEYEYEYVEVDEEGNESVIDEVDEDEVEEAPKAKPKSQAEPKNTGAENPTKP